MYGDDDDFRDLRAAWQKDPPSSGVPRDRVLRRAASVNRRIYLSTALVATVLLVEIIAFGIFFARAHDVMHRVGAVLTSLGMAFLLGQAWENFRIIRRLQARMAGAPSLVFYRAFLEQMRAWSRGRWFWARWLALVPGPPLYIVQDIHRHRDALWVLVIYVVLLLLAIPLNVMLGVRIADRRIAEVDRLTQDA